MALSAGKTAHITTRDSPKTVTTATSLRHIVEVLAWYTSTMVVRSGVLSGTLNAMITSITLDAVFVHPIAL